MKRLLTIGLVLLCTACAGKPVALGTRGAPAVLQGESRTLTSEACGFQLLLLIPIGINGRLDRAYRALEAQAAGDVISDVKVRERWTYGFVGTGYCTELEAKATRLKR